MIGVGFGFGFQPRGRLVGALDASGGPQGDGTVALPSFLTMTCATTGRTSQTSAATLKTGFGANAARGRNVGNGWGLLCASARLQECKNSEDLTAWSATSATVVANVSGPDGASTADAMTFASGASNRFLNLNFSTGTYVFSAWVKNISGASKFRYRIPLAVGSTNQTSPDQTIVATWSRVAWTSAAITVGGVSNPLIENDAAAEAGVNDWYGMQLENGVLYPGPYIPNVGTGTVANAADKLSSAASAVAPGGYFDATMTVAPHYSQAEQAADHDIFFLDSNNRTYLKQSDHKIYQVIGGVSLASAALTFARESALVVRTAHQKSGRTLTVNGVTVTTTAAAAISLPSTAYWLGNASGSQECADLRSLKVYRP